MKIILESTQIMNLDNDQEIKLHIKEIISKITRIDIEKINDHSSLRDELFIDSLQGTQIIHLIQDKYNIKIDEIEIFNVDNIDEIVNLIKEYSDQNH